MKFSHLVPAVLILLSVLVLAGCSDNPGLVGAGLLPSDGTLAVVDTTLFPVSDTVYSIPYAAGLGTNILVGSWNGFNAMALINFTGLTLPDSLAGATIDTARIVLTNSYSWNLGSAQNTYNVYQTRAVWTESGVTRSDVSRIWDSLGSQCGSWSSAFTVGGTTTIIVDTASARQWMVNKPDSTHFRGFALRDAQQLTPAPAGIANGIVGFSSFRTYTPPTLVIKYHRGDAHDSITVSSGEDTFLASGPINTDPAMQPCLETQGGISIRSRIRFDLSSVPKGSIVNSATFSISAKDRMMGIGTPDSIAIFPSLSIDDPSAMDETIYSYGARSDATSETYSASSTSFRAIVQRWITGYSGYSSTGIIIRSGADGYSMDRMLFYSSSDAATSLRPQLRIIYTKKM